MPLFRRITPTPDTVDSTYLFDTNPDPTVFEEVAETKSRKVATPAPEPTTEPVAPDAPTEEPK